MTDPDELGRAVGSVARAFEILDVTWAIGGSLASAAHGEPRATYDVHVIALLDEEAARRMPAELGADFYADADAAVGAVRACSSFNVIDRRSFIKIDVFVPAGGPLGAGQLARRRLLDVLPGLAPVPVLGPEDVVLQKLRWFELGGGVSDRQWRDILSVVRNVGPDLDLSYVEAVARAAGLGDVLERALREGARTS